MNSGYRQPAARGLSEKGFTLLEIMVAIFIFALVLTTIFGSFRIVFSSADAVGTDVVVYASARNCVERISRDLASLQLTHYPRYAKPDFNDPPDPYRLVGDTTDMAGESFGRLRFASLAHLPINRDVRQGVCRIVYYAHQRQDDVIVLRRADHLYPFPDFEESEDDPILCTNLIALEFGYVDAEGEVSDDWDSDSDNNDYATPRAIEVRLTMGDPSRPSYFTTRVPLYVYRDAEEQS
jgi:general secretion pathway protein J